VEKITLVLGLSFKIKTFYLAGGGKQILRGIIFNEGVLRARATVLVQEGFRNCVPLVCWMSFFNVVWERETFSLKFPGLWSGNTIPECFKNWRLQNIKLSHSSGFHMLEHLVGKELCHL
jgi:hypothetical protein